MKIGIGFDVGILFQPRYVPMLTELDVLLFPELVDGGYASIAQGATPHRASDPFFHAFRAASQRFSFYCIAGSMYFADTSSLTTNSSFTFSRGRLIHRYDKVHLFRPTGDHKYFARGNTIRTFALTSGPVRTRAGVVICYDLRFPELIRRLAVQGMKFLFVPARWPQTRDEAWFTLLKARAIENQIFVVGCNAPGEEGGYSYAFDPLGTLVFSNRKRERTALHAFTVDLNRLHEARKIHNNVRDAVLLTE